MRDESDFDPAILDDVLFGQPEARPQGVEEDPRRAPGEFPVLVSPEDRDIRTSGTSYVRTMRSTRRGGR